MKIIALTNLKAQELKFITKGLISWNMMRETKVHIVICVMYQSLYFNKSLGYHLELFKEMMEKVRSQTFSDSDMIS